MSRLNDIFEATVKSPNIFRVPKWCQPKTDINDCLFAKIFICEVVACLDSLCYCRYCKLPYQYSWFII